MQLCEHDITLKDCWHDKDAALRLVAGELVQAGYTTQDYLAGMQAREAQISTYLGNGIAIPHGTPETRDAVIQTGVKVMVFRQGVDWGDGNIARVVVGIAARSNEHLNILRQLTHALADDSVPEAINHAQTPADILTLLTGLHRQSEEETVVSDDAEQAIFTIHNAHGLHARPAAELVKRVKQFDSTITVENLDAGSTAVDAKSLMRVISLGVKHGQRLRFSARGQDAVSALTMIGEMIDKGLGEGLASSPEPPSQPDVKRNWFSRLFS
ncbi:HPr family phosphocarrier protein [Erwinia endophytica]|uniref:HPr family phosphocarrier protein n=1 Tax=Erwinia endophytica TaxID=1563158 RepID=UPI001265FE1C|nr:HPr family phosphocarrier protein [Erwinia endophytica]KAB8307333.1 HPr family phosphocarrier protein [Erwinia endophytica]